GGVDVDVAVAVAVDDDGDGRVLADALDEVRPTPRDEAIHRLSEAHELEGAVARDVVNQDDRVLGEPGLGHALTERGGDRPVRSKGTRGAAEQRGVSSLEADTGRVARHVRAVLVDHGNHTERHPYPLDLQAVWTAPAVDDLTDRVWPGRQLAQTGCHGL